MFGCGNLTRRSFCRQLTNLPFFPSSLRKTSQFFLKLSGIFCKLHWHPAISGISRNSAKMPWNFRRKNVNIREMFFFGATEKCIFVEIRKIEDSPEICEITKRFNDAKNCKFWLRSGAKVCKSFRSQIMLQNKSLVATIGFDQPIPDKPYTPAPPLGQLGSNQIYVYAVCTQVAAMPELAAHLRCLRQSSQR